jgi:hypothetical protein
VSESSWYYTPGVGPEYEPERDRLIEAMQAQDYSTAREVINELRAEFGDEGSRMGEVFKDIYNETQPPKEVVDDVLRPAFGSPRVA